jgi:hypothetical protein
VRCFRTCLLDTKKKTIAMAEIPQPPPANLLDQTAVNLREIFQRRENGTITDGELQLALVALFSQSGRLLSQPHSIVDHTISLSRAKATVRKEVPEFTGEISADFTATQWLETFESEAADAGLPAENWPFAAIRRFPTGSSANLWAASVFGGGLRFKASWEDFRAAFVAQYTPSNALPMAQAAFEQLAMTNPDDNILEFNRKFCRQSWHYDSILRVPVDQDS